MTSLKRKTWPLGATSANLPSSPPPNEIHVFSDSKLPCPPSAWPSPRRRPPTLTPTGSWKAGPLTSAAAATSSTSPGSCLPRIHGGSSITSTRTSLGLGLLSGCSAGLACRSGDSSDHSVDNELGLCCFFFLFLKKKKNGLRFVRIRWIRLLEWWKIVDCPNLLLFFMWVCSDLSVGAIKVLIMNLDWVICSNLFILKLLEW